MANQMNTLFWNLFIVTGSIVISLLLTIIKYKHEKRKNQKKGNLHSSKRRNPPITKRESIDSHLNN